MVIPRRPKVKTATLTVRIDPKIKAAAEAAALRERRSLTSLLEVLILDHCCALGLSPEQLAKESTQ
jgi:predicted HicB family RNase H-like nuclease